MHGIQIKEDTLYTHFRGVLIEGFHVNLFCTMTKICTYLGVVPVQLSKY